MFITSSKFIQQVKKYFFLLKVSDAESEIKGDTFLEDKNNGNVTKCKVRFNSIAYTYIAGID